MAVKIIDRTGGGSHSQPVQRRPQQRAPQPDPRTRRLPQEQPQEAPRKKAPVRAQEKTRRGRISIPKRFRLFSSRSGMDLTLFFLVLALVGVGLVMLFSSSYAYAYYNMKGDSYFFVKKQAQFAVLGIIAMILISYFDYHHLHKAAVPLLIGTIVVLLLMIPLKGTTLVPDRNGAFRWIELPGLGSLQPSEVAKFALILMFAHLISINYNQMNTFKYGILPYVVILGAVCGLVFLEKHLSATLILIMLGIIMLFVGGIPMKWFVTVAAGVAVIGVIAFLVIQNVPQLSYIMDRIYGWLNPLDPPAGVDTWQTKQSLYAIGSGGLLGLGLGKSRQKYLYLPEPQNDFIFAVVCEELGFIGAVLVVLLFAALLWRGVTIALRAQDKFGMLLGIGLSMQIGLQVILNIAVVTNLVPNTGISLPFFSYGGSSLMILLAEMGILLSISRTSNIEKT